jgi:mannose-1-phosphate guanylyltransferase
VLKEVSLAEVSKYGVVQTDDTGRIIQFQEKPAQQDAISTTIIFEPRHWLKLV